MLATQFHSRVSCSQNTSCCCSRGIGWLCSVEGHGWSLLHTQSSIECCRVERVNTLHIVCLIQRYFNARWCAVPNANWHSQYKTAYNSSKCNVLVVCTLKSTLIYFILWTKGSNWNNTIFCNSANSPYVHIGRVMVPLYISKWGFEYLLCKTINLKC